ncbi:tyrosine-type recombinase/integrase [Nitrosospira multiformis]|uniref:tyrosine-type recombinase/integrase n=1 Tax=Nitrosospira multiformis TaxID=1231 RepID=UPI0008962FBA|nr:integrase arm-type DNA-binding domain-containing protein [Nitrosospira multiformis]SDZ82540.1 Integrase [Nitrosospira multiformis]
MPLTDVAVRNAKPANKPYKLTDGKGLYVLVNSAGKYWRFDYRYLGKRKTLALGVYPDVSLADARSRRSNARKLIANGDDPGAIKQAEKQRAKQLSLNTFEAVAQEWHEKQSVKWSPKNSARILSLLVRDIFPAIGKTPIAEVTAGSLLATIQKIEKRGNIETAHRAMQTCGQIFRYAIATGRAHADLSLVLKGALTPVKEKHHPSITDPKKIKHLLLALDGYSGSFITQQALKLAPLLFVRPGELRHAEWSEIDFDAAEWRIAAGKMKMKAVHLVPLPKQALSILMELHPLTGHGRYVFPGVRSWSRPMSENTVNAALRRLGYEKDEMTGHGFRSMASTILHEQGWPHEALERQLAHAERNKVSAAYNYAEHLPKRREMMQAWADYLDRLKTEGSNT